MSAGTGQTLCLVCRTQGLRAALSVGPTWGTLEDAVPLAVCGCLALDGLQEGVGRGDWVQVCVWSGAWWVLCWECL